MTHDLSAAREAILLGRESATGALARSTLAADAAPNTHTYLQRFTGHAEATAAAIDLQHRAGIPLPPLAGLAVSIKALFDVAGFATTAASLALRGRAPATADCPAVARLRRAGAALTGHTHMTEFAFSGVGMNPHHGTPANPATARLDAEPRIPGGSTSGGAVSVATGAAWAALGSDTGGSIRIPAALQGLVGFKNTARLTPTDGTVPLSPTLDTACAITRSVRDAVLLHEVLAGRTVRLAGRPVASLRLAVPATTMLDGLDTTVAAAFTRTLERLRAAGARVDEIALAELAELRALNAMGGFPAAEAWAWHRPLLARAENQYDPRVVSRIRRGETISAADHLDLIAARRDWISRVGTKLQAFDAMLSPTVPVVAPAIAALSTDEAFFAANALLLRNPSVVNFLDGCALSLPCHAPDELPVGLMVWAPALADDTVLDVSRAIADTLSAGGAA
ncbi:amidase [Rhizobacter sp. Root1221]|uniref:amidase n=1 Tax=Rhizobacter sp. Root1221 TaxID=1736433 RepID=UPI0006F8F757|nr:amidase [Rhizobacter sp. Root1221]KQW02964.1 amidase [Rhizobacter sp. Root1221]